MGTAAEVTTQVRALALVRNVQRGICPPHCTVPIKVRSNIDAAIESAARRQFEKSPYVGIRKVRCDFDHGVLKLSGRVVSFYLKQIALATGRHVEGVQSVRNELEVRFWVSHRATGLDRS